MPGFKTNVKDYQAITKTIKQKAFKEKAQEIIDLYVAKKIKNSKTARNAILTISQPRFQRSGQAEVEYQKVVKKYRDAEPMTGRLERETLRKRIKTYSATMMLFKKTEEWDKDKEPDPTLLVRPQKENDDPESDVSQNAREFKKKIKHRHHQDLRQFYIGTFDISLDGIDLQWLNERSTKN